MRGVEIITFNPLRERGLERFVNPQSPIEMATNRPTQISTQYHQVKAGGGHRCALRHMQDLDRNGRRRWARARSRFHRRTYAWH